MRGIRDKPKSSAKSDDTMMEEDGNDDDDDEIIDEREIKLYSQGCEVCDPSVNINNNLLQHFAGHFVSLTVNL